MSIESVPAVHHRIFLSVTYSLEISPSKKSGALSLESNVALGSAIRLAWKNRLSESCLKRSGQKTRRISCSQIITSFSNPAVPQLGTQKLFGSDQFLGVLKNCKIKTKPIEISPVQQATDTTELTNKLIPSLFLQIEEVEGCKSTFWKTRMS